MKITGRYQSHVNVLLTHAVYVSGPWLSYKMINHYKRLLENDPKGGGGGGERRWNIELHVKSVLFLDFVCVARGYRRRMRYLNVTLWIVKDLTTWWLPFQLAFEAEVAFEIKGGLRFLDVRFDCDEQRGVGTWWWVTAETRVRNDDLTLLLPQTFIQARICEGEGGGGGGYGDQTPSLVTVTVIFICYCLLACLPERSVVCTWIPLPRVWIFVTTKYEGNVGVPPPPPLCWATFWGLHGLHPICKHPRWKTPECVCIVLLHPGGGGATAIERWTPCSYKKTHKKGRFWRTGDVRAYSGKGIKIAEIWKKGYTFQQLRYAFRVYILLIMKYTFRYELRVYILLIMKIHIWDIIRDIIHPSVPSVIPSSRWGGGAVESVAC